MGGVWPKEIDRSLNKGRGEARKPYLKKKMIITFVRIFKGLDRGWLEAKLVFPDQRINEVGRACGMFFV